MQKVIAALLSACFALPVTLAVSAELPSSGDTLLPTTDAEIQLGRLLFYDRVLSGSYRVSCATCHNHDRASSNGFASPLAGDELAVGGLPLYDALKPSAKHAPALFNLGYAEFYTLFFDGRVQLQTDGTISTPASENLPEMLRDPLAAQALFPAVTGDELVGSVDSDVRDAAQRGHSAIWDALVDRLHDLPGYEAPVLAAYPDVKSLKELRIHHVGNAIGAFVAHEWRADRAPYDSWLAGDQTALNSEQQRGLKLFEGKAQCSSCHKGRFQTDHAFHNSASPPWRFDQPLNERDFHRDRSDVTGLPQDRHRRRTISLRNINATAPYGFAGSHEVLRSYVEDHIAPDAGMRQWLAQREKDQAAEVLATEILVTHDMPSVQLTQSEIDDLMAFLESLTDERSLSGRLGKPADVPSNLALD
ncbi:cytochrome-c peroxidase [Ahrensia sp. R2A130]|uniref:cytochrome-c peroxidase n=1 Tax=Ahrensia sp. R2A130 TaxID=744979 RepID=UPI0001E0B48B|nr:cytochrome c peroxidase [Ahrensia sp. R2A130]EFL90729.1 Di-heme Cytochrome c peroxidase [Ahrensia sp. R2A130]